MQQLKIYTDGGARGNPGPAAIGVVIKSELGTVLHMISQAIGETTNNFAEYQAVIAALNWVKEMTQKSSDKDIHLNFFLDSNLVVNQLNGLFKIKNSTLKDLFFKIRLLEAEVGARVYYSFIPREKNKEADRLVNQALDKSTRI